MSPAVALALHIAVFLVLGTGVGWAIRRRRHRQDADRITRARHRARLPEQMHLRSHDTRPAPLDDTYHQLEALYRAPAHTERGNQ